MNKMSIRLANPASPAQRSHTAVALLLGGLLLLLLAACGGKMEHKVTFYDNEQWAAELVVTAPADALAMLSAAEVEGELNAIIAEIQANGGQASWKRRTEDNNILYIIESEGQGYDLLREIVLEGAEITITEVDSRRAIHISFAAGDSFSTGGSSVTLVGGEIISSNGLEVEEGVVRWVNHSGRMEAVLTEKSRFNWLGLLLLFGGILLVGGVLVVGGVIFVWRGRNRAKGAVYTQCVQCGTRLSPAAQFCPNCGTPSYSSSWQ